MTEIQMSDVKKAYGEVEVIHEGGFGRILRFRWAVRLR